MKTETLLKRVTRHIEQEAHHPLPYDHPQRIADNTAILKAIKEHHPRVVVEVKGGCAEVTRNPAGVQVIIKDLDSDGR